MGRPVTAAVLTEFAAGRIYPVLFVRGEFSSGYLRFWSGLGDVTWDSQTWQGTGDAMDFTFPEETSELRSEGFTVKLVGVKSAYMSAALSNLRRGLPMECWIGFMDADDTIVADPFPMHPGNLDKFEIKPGGVTSEITLFAEAETIKFTRASGRRYTSEDQNIKYPTDKGFDFTTRIHNTRTIWGGSPVPIKDRQPPPPVFPNNEGL